MITKVHMVVHAFFYLFVVIVLAFALRGLPGNPTPIDLQNQSWTEDGPFELSPERGRFALTYAMIVDKSLSFSVPLARFVIPDLGYKNDKYVSLFAPGVSYIVAPGFMLGTWLGASQVGAYAVIAVFALVNFWLIVRILRALGVEAAAAYFAALVFLFGTPAFSYAVTLYQHHISTFLILLSVYLLLVGHSWVTLSVVWFCVATSVPVDYPNLILMIPIIVWAMSRTLTTSHVLRHMHIKISIRYVLAMAATGIPLIFFLWFNNASYGSPWQFSGTVSSVKDIGDDGKPMAPKTVNKFDIEKFTNPTKQKKSASGFFKTRNMLNGLYILLLSPDRGGISFAPILLAVLPGLFLIYRRQKQISVILISIIALNVVLYSLWGDPWGGWAFGARYLVPSYALGAILLGILLSEWHSSVLFLALCMNLFAFSTIINTSGALTSSANPPKVEVLNLEALSGHEEKYTYQRNVDQLHAGSSKSFVYRAYLSKSLTAWEFYQLISGSVIVMASMLLVLIYIGRRERI